MADAGTVRVVVGGLGAVVLGLISVPVGLAIALFAWFTPLGPAVALVLVTQVVSGLVVTLTRGRLARIFALSSTGAAALLLVLALAANPTDGWTMLLLVAEVAVVVVLCWSPWPPVVPNEAFVADEDARR